MPVRKRAPLRGPAPILGSVGRSGQAQRGAGAPVLRTADLTALDTPAVDEQWFEARKPLEQAISRKIELEKKIRKYERANYNADHYRADVAKLEQKIAELKEAERPFLEEWERRGGWSRAYLVTNADGHVHRTTNCSTCHMTTQFVWLPQLSGASDDEVIAEVGFKACTVCYPAAPTHPAFLAGEKEAVEAAKQKADAQCPASGEYANEAARAGSYTWGRRYCTCGTCGKSVSVTPAGKLRAHKR